MQTSGSQQINVRAKDKSRHKLTEGSSTDADTTDRDGARHISAGFSGDCIKPVRRRLPPPRTT